MPIHQDDQSIIDAKTFRSKPTKEVLVLEDTPSIQMVYHAQLGRTSYVFDLVETGKAALVTLEKTTYRLIILDVGLPDMNGQVICRHIRENAFLGHVNTPILMLSASGDLVRQACLDAGATNFFVKTMITTKAFQRTVAYYLNNNTLDQ